jgi:hypothetical protein
MTLKWAKLFITTVLFLCLGNALCQENDKELNKPISVSFSFGGSVPVGAFSSSNTKSSNSGLAKIGGTLRGTLDYYIKKKNWGISFNYDRVSFPLNSSSLSNSFIESNPGYSINSISPGWWVLNNFQIGAFNVYTLKNKYQKPSLIIENRCMIGLATISSPSISLFSSNGTSGLSFSQRSKNTSAFSVSFGGGISSIPKNHLFLKATIDLCRSYGRFNNIEVTQNENGTISSTTKSLTQPINYLSVGWAIGWRF